MTHLQFDLGLGDILLASIAAGNLLGLGDTSTDSVSAEVLQGVSLGGVDAQDGVGLDRGKATRHYIVVFIVSPAIGNTVADLEGLSQRTEELLGGTALLNNLDQAGLELLDGRNVVGEDTHVTGLGGDVDLDDILGLVDGLQSIAVISIAGTSVERRISSTPAQSDRFSSKTRFFGAQYSYLVRQGQAQLDL